MTTRLSLLALAALLVVTCGRDPETIERGSLLDQLPNLDEARLVALLGHDDDHVADAAYDELRGRHPAGLPEIGSALGMGSPAATARALGLIYRHRRDAARYSDAVMDQVRSADSAVRAQAIRAFLAIAPADPRAVDVLGAGLQSADDQARRFASLWARGLGEQGVPAIERVLLGDSAGESQLAAVATCSIILNHVGAETESPYRQRIVDLLMRFASTQGRDAEALSVARARIESMRKAGLIPEDD